MKNTHGKKHEKGFAVLAALMMLTMMGAAGVSAVSMVSSDNSGRALAWSDRQAFAVANAALEYGRVVQAAGGNPVVNNKAFGPGTFSIAMAGNNLSVTANVGQAIKSNSIQLTGGGSTSNPNDPNKKPTVNKGDVTVKPNNKVDVKVLCKQIQSGNTQIPVKAGIRINSNYQTMYNNQYVVEGNVWSTNSGASGSTYRTKGIAYLSSTNTLSYWSTDTVQVKTLVNGQKPPNITGYNGQVSAKQCVAPYLDSAGKVKLDANQVIYFFELGMNANNYPTSAATDFQDLVLLMTVGGA